MGDDYEATAYEYHLAWALRMVSLLSPTVGAPDKRSRTPMDVYGFVAVGFVFVSIVALVGQKGGSGKSTTAVALAVEWHARGLRVLLVDASELLQRGERVLSTARTKGNFAYKGVL